MDKPTFSTKLANPCCGYLVDCATEVIGDGSDVPEQGDFSICFQCGAWLRYTDAAGGTRIITAEDWLEISDEQRAKMKEISVYIQGRRTRS